MKKWIFYVMVIATMGLVSVGCNSDDEPEIPAEPEVPLYRPSKYIKENTAVKLAMKALVDFGYMTTEQASEAQYNISLKSNLLVDSLYFEVEFPGVAYVAVDADYYNPVGVVAVCETSPPQERFLNNVLPFSQVLVKDWSSIPVQAYAEYSYPTPAWSQSKPYNAYMPIFYDKRCVLGRQPVAIGEILAYYKLPVIVDGQQFDWSSFDPYNPDEAGLDKIARLLYQIGQDACTNFSDAYGYSASITEMRDYFASNDFNWSLCNVEGLIASDVMTKGPALMASNYVADGMKRWTSGAFSTTYLHCNFGNNGNGNGYYLVNARQSDRQTKELCELSLPKTYNQFLALSRQ